MKNRLMYGLMAVLLCLCVLLSSLWMQERNKQEDLAQLCQSSAMRAMKRFAGYRDTGSIYDYAYAVSELTSFYNAYCLLVENICTNRISLNQLLGKLMYFPRLESSEIEYLIDAMGMLSRNTEDENAYWKLTYVYNILER